MTQHAVTAVASATDLTRTCINGRATCGSWSLVVTIPAEGGARFTSALDAALKACRTSRNRAAADLFPDRGRVLDRPAKNTSILKDEYLDAILDNLVVHDAPSRRRLRDSPVGLELAIAHLQTKLAAGTIVAASNSSTPPDLVAIGALNYDHIAVAGDVPLAVDSNARWEEEVDDERVIDDRLRSASEVSGSEIVHALGGSAFNVMRLLLDPRLECRTAFIGMSGKVPAIARGDIPKTHRQYLVDHRRRCDVTLLGSTNQIGGRCAAVMRLEDHGGSQATASRLMSTWQGANRLLARHLLENFEAALGMLASARMVYLTSVFDPAASELVATLVENAVRLNPSLQVAFDPGEKWASEQTAPVGRILSQTSILLLNTTEVDALARSYTKPDSESWPERIVGQMRTDDPHGSLIVVKDAGKISFHRTRHSPDAIRWENPAYPDELPASLIRDDTGAGDTFAAGYVAALLSRPLQSQLGGHLGLALARTKLQQAGGLEAKGLPDTAQSLLGRFLSD